MFYKNKPEISEEKLRDMLLVYEISVKANKRELKIYKQLNKKKEMKLTMADIESCEEKILKIKKELEKYE